MSTPEALKPLQDAARRDLAFDVRFANRSVIEGSGSPGALGSSLFEHGVRYAAVLQDIEPARPFFEGSSLAFERELRRPAPKLDRPVHDTLHDRFAFNFGAFASAELLARNDEPAETTRLAVALSALQMAFTPSVLDEAKDQPARLETTDFGRYLITFLALAAVARWRSVRVDPMVDRTIAPLPVPQSFEGLRRPLRALIAEPGNATTLRDYSRAFRAVVHAGACQAGLVGGLRFTEAYIWSLPCEHGHLASALVRLLAD